MTNLELNPKQLDAVQASQQFVRVVAGAGTGKTRVLTSRIAYLIETMGVPSYRIYAITFTNKAAQEMRERVDRFVPGHEVRLSTFHSLAVRILREDIEKIGRSADFTIIDEQDQNRIVKGIIKDHDFSLKPSDALSYISRRKSGSDVPTSGSSSSFFREHSQVYDYYQAALEASNYLDFDDLLIFATLVLEDAEVGLKWKRRIHHLLVDEFQDTNDVQYRMMKLLSDETTNIYVVGDADQTIYTWRGANSRLFTDFERSFPGAATYVLDINYRSTQQILDFANELIRHNQEELQKTLRADRGSGMQVVCDVAASSLLEALGVCSRITQLRHDNPEASVAILVRASYLTRPVEMELQKRKLRYRIYGGVRFFEREEIKDIVCYLRFIAREADVLAFERVINKPRRGIGLTTQELLAREAVDRGISLPTMYRRCQEVGVKPGTVRAIEDFFAFVDLMRSRITSLGPLGLVEEILIKTRYLDDYTGDEKVNKSENIDELCRFIEQEMKNNPDLDLESVLNNIVLYSVQDEIDGSDVVNVMTVHAAKGLEYDYVFVVGMSEMIFPNYRSVMEGNIKEERRLAYVAFTRARRGLFLSSNYDYNYNTGTRNVISRFIREARPGRSPTPERTTPRIEVPPTSTAPLKAAKEWRVGDQVRHSELGIGEVVEEIGPRLIKIQFKEKAMVLFRVNPSLQEV